MPVSKRDKKISLTKTAKKGVELKQKTVDDVQKFVVEYDHLFVFTVNNMRNTVLKTLREEWKSNGRFLFAKKKVMKVALGQTKAEESHKNLNKLVRSMSGQCGLFFTNKPKEEVIQWFNEYSAMEYARSGFVAAETVTLPAGPLPDFDAPIEPHLRFLGLPTQMVKGTIVLREDHTVCTQGEQLTPNAASLLKLLGRQMAEFKVILMCVWSKGGSFEKFKIPEELRETLTIKADTKRKRKRKAKGKDATQKQDKITPKSTPKHDKTTPQSTPTAQKQELESDKSSGNTLKATPVNNNVKTKTLTEEPQTRDEGDEVMEVEPTKNTIEKENLRRSMRTPKPAKRTPETAKLSVKKLTESAKQLKRTPAKQTPNSKAKSTPLATSSKKTKTKIAQIKETDLEMDE